VRERSPASAAAEDEQATSGNPLEYERLVGAAAK